MTSYLPKALFPNTVTLRIRFQHMNLGVRDTNIQSINGVRLSSLLQSELVLWLALTNRTQQKWLSGTSKFRPEEGWHFTSCTFELEPSCEKSRLHCEREKPRGVTVEGEIPYGEKATRRSTEALDI